MTHIDPSKINPSARSIMGLLGHYGHGARIAGGAVRDILTGKDPKDWDIATTATPEQVTELFDDHGCQVIPTGIKHGTVTVMINGEPFEITTLRIDTDADGRHATVEFTTDWKLDAARRDFTMNAMFLDINGVVWDFFNGIEDLKNGDVKFVGNAEDRIREDYLRILRFFRFFCRATETSGSVDLTDTMNAIRNTASGISGISGERVWSEFRKMLTEVPAAFPTAFFFMRRAGVTEHLGLDEFMFPLMYENPEDKPRNLYRVFHWAEHNQVDPVTFLALYVRPERMGDFLKYLKDRLKLSNEELRPLRMAHTLRSLHTRPDAVEQVMAGGPNEDEFRAWVALNTFDDQELAYHRYSVMLKRVTDLGLVSSGATGSEALQAVCRIKNLFPVTGQDLLAAGVQPGPNMGMLLNMMRVAWARDGFLASRDALMADMNYRV